MAQDPKTPQETEEHLRSLGIALASGWNLLPPYAQDQLLDHACNFDTSRTSRKMQRSLRAALEKKQLLKANPKAEGLGRSTKRPRHLSAAGKV